MPRPTLHLTQPWGHAITLEQGCRLPPTIIRSKKLEPMVKLLTPDGSGHTSTWPEAMVDHVWGPTPPTALGTMGRCTRIAWWHPCIAPAANRAMIWSHLHHHQHHDVNMSLSLSMRPTGHAYKRRSVAQPWGCLLLYFSLSSVLLSLSRTPGPFLGL
jgi:hypothetical protein